MHFTTPEKNFKQYSAHFDQFYTCFFKEMVRKITFSMEADVTSSL